MSALWLLWVADSATSTAALAVGVAALVWLRVWLTRGSRVTLLANGFVASLITIAWLGQSSVIAALGRDTTLTGRTNLWQEFTALVENPVFGTGFESFFIGWRATLLWERYWWHPNEAHNGYLEVYLTLGLCGLSVFIVTIVCGYWKLLKSLRRDLRIAPLQFAFMIAALVYNFSESATKVMHPVWVVLLFSTFTLPIGLAPARQLPAHQGRYPTLPSNTLRRNNSGLARRRKFGRVTEASPTCR
jgi:O-antigen ligase